MSKKLLVPFVEDEEKRLKWIAYLEFSHNKEVSELTWNNINVVLPRTEKLRSMVREGIAHDLRAELWLRLSGALQKKMTADTTYDEILKEANSDTLMTSKQIDKDLLRIIPSNCKSTTFHIQFKIIFFFYLIIKFIFVRQLVSEALMELVCHG